MKEWKLNIESIDGRLIPVTFENLESWKDTTIPVEDYVPNKQAEAVYVKQILEQHTLSNDVNQAVFIADDGFQQKVDKEELGQAFLVFKQNGERLTKGYPVRLYVPDGQSDCLNVKSVVQIQLLKA